MTRPLHALLIGALAVLFAGAGLLFYQWRAGALGDRPPDPKTAGQMVLAARLMGLDDQPQALEQWRGKVLVDGLESMDFARQVGNRLGVLPFTLVIDRSGKVTTSEVGI